MERWGGRPRGGHPIARPRARPPCYSRRRSMDAVTQVPAPVNETVLDYAPGSPERASLEVALAELGATQVELPHVIDGRRVSGTGRAIRVRQPHAHRSVLGTLRNATVAEGQAAVDAAKAAAPMW